MNKPVDPNPAQPASARAQGPRGPVAGLLNLFSNIWLGVFLLSVIFVYCWLGSGGLFYPIGLNIFSGENWGHVFVRHYFEKTEMEWFVWWPFCLTLSLLATALITVTLRRIPFNAVNLGVWCVHTGLLTLMLGSVIYFGQKVEGDVAVYRRQAIITAPGAAEPVSLILRPGNSVVLQAADKRYEVSVSSLMPDYTLRSGADAGKQTYMAQLAVRGPSGEFIRQLLVGYPQYTEDVLPGQGRAIKAIGKPLVDEDLQISLDYAPEEYFYLARSAALYARVVGDPEWVVYPIHKLPKYHEYLTSRQDIFTAPGDPLPSIRPLDIELNPAPDAVPIEDFGASVVSFLPYAVEQTRWVEGGPTLNPLAGFRLRVGEHTESFELLALDSRHSRESIGDSTVRFRWVETPEELQEQLRPRDPRVRVRVPSKKIDLELPVSDLRTETGYKVPDTDYVLSIRQLIPDWVLASSGVRGTKAFIAWVDVITPTKRFSRIVVHPDASLSQDIDEDNKRHAELLDPDLLLELIDPCSSELVLLAGPDGVGMHAVLSYESGQRESKPVEIGKEVEFLDGSLGVRVDRLVARPRSLRRPALIPRRERDAKAGSQYSMIRLEVRNGVETQSVWIPFNQYPHPSRFGFFPRTVTLADGRRIELLYSRDRLPLPVPVALEEFELVVYPGGTRERDYISRVRFLEDGKWSEPFQVNSNNPTAHRGMWFFQATWDPPDPSQGYAGMNYTGLGVGNREGVLVMLGGTILSVVGMIYAFYVKPIIKRLRRNRVLADLAAQQSHSQHPSSPPAQQQPIPQPAQTP